MKSTRLVDHANKHASIKRMPNAKKAAAKDVFVNMVTLEISEMEIAFFLKTAQLKSSHVSF
jgi:hypothetical protein